MRCSRRVERVLRNGKAVATVRGARASSQGRGGKVLYAQGPTDRAPNGGHAIAEPYDEGPTSTPFVGPIFIRSGSQYWCLLRGRGRRSLTLVGVATLILISRDLR